MPIPKFFKTEFDAIAINDALGHPNGELAYAYLRVSSSGQAEEGRSGLPRQLVHVHEAAVTHRLKIPWDYLFADDDSGFEFNERPDLSHLRQEYRSSTRRAHAVVMEHLDRLSRNADWHQGYLLDEMKQFGLHAVFWKPFASRIERVVMGAVAQDGMEQAKLRMAQGSLHKAKSGRVTAKVAAYGYKFVDSLGNEGPTAKKDTHYGIKEGEADVVRYIFRKVLEGYPLRRIAIMLEGRVAPPKRFTYWEPKMIELIVKRPLYKGEFIAHRNLEVKIQKDSRSSSLTESSGRTVTRKIQRPSEEWIVVPVPAIVSTEDWQRANEIVAKNLDKGRREAVNPFLLSGLISCATCGSSYIGRRRKEKKNRRQNEYTLTCYRCAGQANRIPAVREKLGCNQKQISMRILDQSVWSVIYKVLLNPEIMLSALEREFHSEQNEQVRVQLEYLDSQIQELKLDDERLYKAYLADAFDETEYGEHRILVTMQLQKLQLERNKLESNLMLPEQFEEKKQEIVLICENARQSGLMFDAPFEIRQRIIKTIVDRITLNANEGWFEMEGVISGQYLFESSNEQDPGAGGSENGKHHSKFGGDTHYPTGSPTSFTSRRLSRVRLRLTSRINVSTITSLSFVAV